MPKISRQRAGTYLADFDFSRGGDLAASLNMYCSHRGDGVLESFPGFRNLMKLDATIHGIYRLNEKDDSYLVHAGAALYRCGFINQYKDIFSRRKLCDMADEKSFAFRDGDKIYIIDGEDITVVFANESVQKLGENPTLAYVPTTYINGEEAEQVNMLSDLFKEEIHGILEEDFALGTDGLIYEITSEKDGTCAVCGAGSISSGRVDVPSRKMIGGRYYKVTEIADSAFAGRGDIKTFVMSPSVKRVGIQAFRACTSLETVVMPDGIEEIDSAAFSGCSALLYIYLGASCKKIYYNAFDNCSSIDHVYISKDHEDISDCDGIGVMLNYLITYCARYDDFYLGLPVFTPARAISAVLVNGNAVSYTFSAESGTIGISLAECGRLEGADIVISGEIDRSVALNSERKTPLSLLLDCDGKDVILSAVGAEILDGRTMLYGSADAKNVVLTSSMPLLGKTDLLYFGELDYFAAGAAEYEVSCIKAMAKYIVISKRDEMGGSIFVYTPKGAADAAFGRSYERLYQSEALGVRSDLVIYHYMVHFVTDEGIFRMKLSASSPTIEKVSEEGIFQGSRGCPALSQIERELCGDMADYEDAKIIIDTFRDFLVVIRGDTMLLGDGQLAYKSNGEVRYRWFNISDMGTYTNEELKYCYAETAPAGFYIHPDAGEICKEVIYSVGDTADKLIYFVMIGNRRYAVTPTQESYGGSFSPVRVILPGDDTMIFATESGQICALNTDKRGFPPRRIYEAEGFDAEEYKKAFGELIHPEFYAHGKRSVLYAIASEACDGNAPYMTKRSLRGSLVARLDGRGDEPVHFADGAEGEVSELCEVSMGGFDFSDLNFAHFSMKEKGTENVSILESRGKWVNKQIIIYTYGIKSPFAIRGLSFGFQIASQIKNS